MQNTLIFLYSLSNARPVLSEPMIKVGILTRSWSAEYNSDASLRLPIFAVIQGFMVSLKLICAGERGTINFKYSTDWVC